MGSCSPTRSLLGSSQCSWINFNFNFRDVIGLKEKESQQRAQLYRLSVFKIPRLLVLYILISKFIRLLDNIFVGQ